MREAGRRRVWREERLAYQVVPIPDAGRETEALKVDPAGGNRRGDAHGKGSERPVPAPFGAPKLATWSTRDFPITTSCSVPAAATAVQLDVAVTNSEGVGYAPLKSSTRWSGWPG